MDQFFSEQWSIGNSLGIAIKLEVVFPDAIYQSIPMRDASYGSARTSGVPDYCGQGGWNTPPTELW